MLHITAILGFAEVNEDICIYPAKSSMWGVFVIVKAY